MDVPRATRAQRVNGFSVLIFLFVSKLLIVFCFFLCVVETEYDLLESVMSQIDDKTLYIADGLDGFPSFGFRPGSEIKQPYRMYLPEKLPSEFTLVATFKPLALKNSYLFAVLNPFETVVQLGIRISVSLPASAPTLLHLCYIYTCKMWRTPVHISSPRYQLSKLILFYLSLYVRLILEKL